MLLSPNYRDTQGQARVRVSEIVQPGPTQDARRSETLPECPPDGGSHPAENPRSPL
jgi:hypothetical protein